MKKIVTVLISMLVLFGCNSVAEQKTTVGKVGVFEETGKQIYYNGKYGFQIPIKMNFKFEYLPDDIGVKMLRDSSAEVRDKQTTRMDYYTIEIGVMALSNTEEKDDLSIYVAGRFLGYNIEFFGDGIFVDERSGDFAIRHYFLMGADRKYIYEAYLKVPGFHYGLHKDGFDEFVKTIKIF